MRFINIFNMKILSTQHQDAVDMLLAQDSKTTAFFVNAHCINTAATDEEYRHSLERSDYLLPDGSGLALAAALKGEKFAANLNGTDLFKPLCETAARKGLSIYFLGSAKGVAAAAAAKARRAFPDLQIAGTDHGFFKPEDTGRVIERINQSGADILLVAMGVPMQENWITEHRGKLNPCLTMGVGAQFDFHAGRISRAPRLFRKAGCEWVWRLVLEPRRMAKRYIVGNPLFVVRAVGDAAKARFNPASAGALAKRVLDLTIASVAALVLSPLLLTTAAAIRLESPGPVFFMQTRVGQNGRPFRILKFRSMYRDAEARRAQLLAQSDRDGVCFKAKQDPRITRIGRWLRRFSIDELPQLFNVLKGEMSLVGPRPALPEEVAAYPVRALGRLEAKPGLTGIWQVSGRADVGFDKMIDMDLAYVRSRSIWLDLALLALTGRAVVSGRGAY